MILFRGRGPAFFREAVCQAMADDASRHRTTLP
jgi:hypothetical protein